MQTDCSEFPQTPSNPRARVGLLPGAERARGAEPHFPSGRRPPGSWVGLPPSQASQLSDRADSKGGRNGYAAPCLQIGSCPTGCRPTSHLSREARALPTAWGRPALRFPAWAVTQHLQGLRKQPGCYRTRGCSPTGRSDLLGETITAEKLVPKPVPGAWRENHHRFLGCAFQLLPLTLMTWQATGVRLLLKVHKPANNWSNTCDVFSVALRCYWCFLGSQASRMSPGHLPV